MLTRAAFARSENSPSILVPVLSLTHAARNLISEMLANEPEGTVLRISSSPEGPHIGLDRVRIGDNTFSFDSKCVLAVDQMVLRNIAGRTLDVEYVNGIAALVLVGE